MTQKDQLLVLINTEAIPIISNSSISPGSENHLTLETITIVSKSLYRYDTYIHDAENSKSSRKLWETFKVQREKELSMLLKELKN